MTTSDSDPSTLSVEALERINRVCVEFEAAEKQDRSPRIEDYLRDVGGDERSKLLEELLLLELEYRRRKGDSCSREEYISRFPDDTVPVDLAFSSPLQFARPERVGPYRILEVLGEGGMGVVYLAEQKEPIRRQVALKLIKLGMDTKEVVARFEAERQALAMMDHPNIARVYDAGATREGRPYFVMEHVAGVPITEYCDRQRLNTRERVELVLHLCTAVQHAHQKAIIHRDIKPSNVLVSIQDGKPLPKIIDFGVAKATNQRLTEATIRTELGQIVGTLEYMSPEQAELTAHDIDTRSDIYSLGILLYELLVGTRPFDSARLRRAGWAEIQRILREEEPPKPSTRLSDLGEASHTLSWKRRTQTRFLVHKLRGDLDCITMKAIEKDRTRRYSTAVELGADLSRYLNQEPVLARPASAVYRLRKFVRKNRGPVLAGSLLILVLMAGFIVSFVLYLRSTRLLATSYFDQAQAWRWSGRAGQRYRSLEAIAGASEVYSSLGTLEEHRVELRNEAIAAMALVDLRVAREWVLNRGYDAEACVDAVWERFALADAQGDISVRRLDDNQEIARLPGKRGAYCWLKLSPNGRFLAAQHGEKLVVIWDVDRKEKVKRWACKRAGFDFSPDTRLFAAAQGEKGIVLYDLSTGGEERLPALGTLVCFHPDSRKLVVANGSELAVWDSGVGRVVRSMSAAPERLFGLTVSPDGRLLAAGCGDCHVYVWAIGTGELKCELIGHQKEVHWLAFNRKGDILASWGWDGTRLWDPVDGRSLLSAPGHVLNWSPDDRWLAFSQGAQVGLWLAATRREYRTFRGDYPLHGPDCATFSPDGSLLICSGDGGTRFWNVGSGREAGFLAGHGRPSFQPNGEALFTVAAHDVYRWPVEPDKLQRGVLRIGPPQPLGLPGDPLNPSFNLTPDGETLAVAGSKSRGIIVCKPDHPSERVVLRDHGDIALSPGGKWVAVASERGPIRIWDLESWQIVQQLPAIYPRISFSPDGKWLVAGNVYEYQFWETGSWHLGLEIPRGGTELPGPVAFTRDGTLVAIMQTHTLVRLLDPRTGGELATLESPDSRIVSFLCFSPDGTRLAAACDTHVTQVWDLLAIRAGLASMNLDWELPSYPPREPIAGEVQVIVTDQNIELEGAVEHQNVLSLDLGETNTGAGLECSHLGDGITRVARVGPEDDLRDARCSEATGPEVGYVYFEVTAPRIKALRRVWITATFFDDPAYANGPVPVQLEYTTDKAAGPGDNPRSYFLHPIALVLEGTGRWVSKTWLLRDAGFRSWMNYGADFRFVMRGSGGCIDRIELDVESTEVQEMSRFTHAKDLQQAGKHSEAADEFAAIIEKNDHHAGALLGWGRSLRVLGRSGEAERRIRQAIRGELGEDRDLRDLWLALALGDLGRTPTELLGELATETTLDPGGRGDYTLRLLEELNDRGVTDLPLDADARGFGDRLLAAAISHASPNVWRQLRRLVSSGRTSRTAEYGGVGGLEFTILPEEGAFLVGFRATLGLQPGGWSISTLQPIFLGEGGRFLGEQCGDFRGLERVLEAKPGYAVGGWTIRSDDLVRSLKLRFQRIRGSRLDPDDSYESAWVGGEWPTEHTITGTAAPIVGIYGRRGTLVDALGPVVAGR